MADSHPAGRRSIGAVLEELRTDFPDVTVSKIRFLEARGLVNPQRTAAGYRSFDEADVQRLRYILTAQRDRFWPLKVIREALDAMDRGLEPAGEPDQRPRVPTPEHDPQVPSAHDLSQPAKPLRLTRAEVIKASGLSPAMLDALVGYGLLQAGLRWAFRLLRPADRRRRGGAGVLRYRGAAPAALPHGRRPRDRAGPAGRRPGARSRPGARRGAGGADPVARRRPAYRAGAGRAARVSPFAR